MLNVWHSGSLSQHVCVEVSPGEVSNVTGDFLNFRESKKGRPYMVVYY